jgi:ribose transport system permease protein
MMVGRGLSLKLTNGNTIYDLPSSFEWLGQGRSLGVVNSVWLLVLLYVVAHLVMTRTRFGRYVYAIGGNEQAARLSGVPVRLVLVSLYAISALSAALGGFICASRVRSGVPKPPDMLEMYVIAAVVVGGTSLAGGSGSVPGTLVGALIIAVIQNGMNLMNIDSYTQYIVLGAIILGAVLVDGLRHSERFRRRLLRPRAEDTAIRDRDGS